VNCWEKLFGKRRNIDLWRIAVTISFVASILRSGVFADGGSLPVWYALQFGPILVAIFVSLLSPAPRLRRVDRLIMVSMGAVVAASALSAVSSANRQDTLAQAGILGLMFGFFAVTFWRRWTARSVIRGDLLLVFILICTVQLVGLACGLFQLPFAFSYFGRFTGLMSNANYAGMLACLALPLAVYIYRSFNRWIAVTGAALSIVALLMSGSRGALVAAGLGLLALVFFLPIRQRIITLGTLVLAIILGLLVAGPLVMSTIGQTFTRESQNTDITSGRGVIYAQMVEAWLRNPWTGYGYHETDFVTAGLSGHNTYLSTLTETGAIGFLAFLALMFGVIAAGPWRTADRFVLGVVVSVAVVEATESAIFGWGGPTALVSWVMLLGFAALGRDEGPAVPGLTEVNSRQTRSFNEDGKARPAEA